MTTLDHLVTSRTLTRVIHHFCNFYQPLPVREIARRFAPQVKQPDVQYAVGNASQGLAAGRNTKAMKAVEENYER